MIKTPPTFGRLLTMVVFSLSCFGLLLYLWLSFGGVIPLKPKSYRFHLAFPEATQLVAQADVRISGVGVGKVVKVSPRGNRTDALIELEARYAPAATDWRAILRTKTLLGETYISLRRGSPDAPKVPDNGTVADSTVAPTVELDEIIGTFKPATRAAFRTWMQSQAAAGAGRGVDVNAAFYELPGFATSSTRSPSAKATSSASSATPNACFAPPRPATASSPRFSKSCRGSPARAPGHSRA